MTTVLSVANLKTQITTARGLLTVVDDISFTLEEGECFGLVGESGSGKSMICRSILRLPPRQALTPAHPVRRRGPAGDVGSRAAQVCGGGSR